MSNNNNESSTMIGGGLLLGFAIIARAVKRTAMEDVRCQELQDALAFLERFSIRDRPFRDFKASLGIADPVQRFHAMKDAALRIAKGLNA